MSEREDYLDELLKEVKDDSENPEEQAVEEKLLDDYDREMNEIDEDEFLKEFEDSLGNLDSDFEMELSDSEAGERVSADFMDSIGQVVNDVKNGNLKDDSEEESGEGVVDELRDELGGELDNGLGDIFGDGDLSMEESLKNFEEADPEMDEIGSQFSNDDSGISEAEKLAREIEGLNLEAEIADNEEKEEVIEKPVEQAAELQEEEPKKKKGFFARLSTALFGEDEDDAPEKAISQTPGAIEELSEEELDALMAMENAAAADEKAQKKQKKEEKKALKEQKAKEKEEQKAEKKALKEQKAREKAEKKAVKKSQTPVEKSKPLPKKPVALIVLLGVSVVILVNLLSGLVGYNTSLSEAKDCYAKGEYVEAYGYLNEKDMKEADVEFYNKVRLTAYLQQQLNSFQAYQSRNMYQEALSALICGVGRYDRFLKEATEAGVDREYEKMLQTITEELSSKYQMSVEEARAIYALDDKKEFTYAVYDVVNGLGLVEKEP